MTTDAVRQLRELENALPALLEIAANLEKLGGLQNAIAEAEARLAELRKQTGEA